MRVLHIISSMNPENGGVCKAVRTMILGLSRLGVINEVVSMDNTDAGFISHDTFKTYAIGKGMSSWSYTSKLIPWLKENIKNYDAVIIHGLWQYHSYATHKVWRHSKTNKPKLFVMPHGMLDPYFQHAPGRRWKAIRNWLFWKFIEHRSVNEATALLFTCETEKILARGTFSPYIPKQEYVVGLGVDAPPVFNHGMKAAFETKTGGPVQSYLLFIGRIDKKKGIDLLIDAYVKLSIAGMKLPQLVIAGPGIGTEYGKEMFMSASGNKNILFPGMLSGDAKWGAFYGAEAFILTSHQENFGYAVVEALACEKPVLISNKINIWEEISDYRTGFIDDDSIEGAERLLLKWLNLDMEARKLMGKKAHTCFFENFTIEIAANRVYEILK